MSLSLLKKYKSILNASGKYVTSQLLGQRVPLYVGLFLTQRCNLKCIYCFPDSPNRKQEKEFSLDEIFRIVDELYALGTRYLTLLGGEPLIRDDFGQIVDYIVKKNMIVETGTNGYFTPLRLNDLKKLTLVCHSIDGDEEGHDKNRGSGSFRKALESLQLCRKNNIPVQMRAVFTRNNVHSLEYLLKLAQKLKTSLGLAEQAVVKEADKAWGMDQLELREFWKKVKEYKKAGYSVDKSFLLLDRIINYPAEYSVEKIFKKGEETPQGYPWTRCSLSCGYMFIDSDGMAYPCARLFKKFGRSIYGDGGIKGAWDYLAQNDCLFCRQSVQDLKSYFFARDLEALKVAAMNLLRK